MFNLENLWKLERAHESGKEGGVAKGERIVEHSEENSCVREVLEGED